MFGFIKMIEQIIAKLKSNKRVWFTTIFALSVSGIALSILMLITTTDRIANEVYISQNKDFTLRYKELEKLKEKRLEKLTLVASNITDLFNAFSQKYNDKILAIENELNTKMGEKDKENLFLDFI